MKIEAKLPTGDKLVAEWDEAMPYLIAVGVVNKDDVWIQDLAVVEHFEDKNSVYVYEDEYDENWTKKFVINRVPDDAL